MTSPSVKTLNPVKAWAVTDKIMNPVIFYTRKEARDFYLPNQGEKLIRVEIREIKRKKK